MFAFARIGEQQLELVRDWRTRPHVVERLFTPGPADAEQQRRWFAGVRDDDTRRYWVVSYGDTPIGLVHLTGIDRASRRAVWGFFIGEPDYLRLGGLVPPYLFNHAFADDGLGLLKLSAEVLPSNESALRVNRGYGAVDVGVLRSHMLRDGRFEDVLLLELLADDWAVAGRRFRSCRAVFA